MMHFWPFVVAVASASASYPLPGSSPRSLSSSLSSSSSSSSPGQVAPASPDSCGFHSSISLFDSLITKCRTILTLEPSFRQAQVDQIIEATLEVYGRSLPAFQIFRVPVVEQSDSARTCGKRSHSSSFGDACSKSESPKKYLKFTLGDKSVGDASLKRGAPKNHFKFTVGDKSFGSVSFGEDAMANVDPRLVAPIVLPHRRSMLQASLMVAYQVMALPADQYVPIADSHNGMLVYLWLANRWLGRMFFLSAVEPQASLCPSDPASLLSELAATGKYWLGQESSLLDYIVFLGQALRVLGNKLRSPAPSVTNFEALFNSLLLPEVNGPHVLVFTHISQSAQLLLAHADREASRPLAQLADSDARRYLMAAQDSIPTLDCYSSGNEHFWHHPNGYLKSHMFTVLTSPRLYEEAEFITFLQNVLLPSYPADHACLLTDSPLSSAARFLMGRMFGFYPASAFSPSSSSAFSSSSSSSSSSSCVAGLGWSDWCGVFLEDSEMIAALKSFFAVPALPMDQWDDPRHWFAVCIELFNATHYPL